MHLINAQYRILDVFEKNPLQNMMLGSAIGNTDDIVVINEVIWSPLFTVELAQSLFDGFINLKTHSEDDTSCQLVTAYHKGMPISKYLSSRSLPFRNRINLSYEFLKAMVSYEDFPPWIQDILIDEDQIIVWEDRLLYNELLILKTDDAGYADKISFAKVRKKIHAIISRLIGGAGNGSPALVLFLERLNNDAAAHGSLQAIYDDFQNVYLYDYYLDRDDSVQPVAPVIVTPSVLPFETEAVPVDDAVETVETVEPDVVVPEHMEAPGVIPLDEVAAESVPPPDTDAPPEETPAVPPASELDAVDEDMEKNLELFFNRNRQQSEIMEDDYTAPKKKSKLLWILLAAAVLLMTAWGAFKAFNPDTGPVASFTAVQKDGIWVLENQSTFSKRAGFKRAEWTVFQNGKLIELFDTLDLTLSLEDEDNYQVILRVMDNDGKWSQPFKKTLENHLTSAEPAKPKADAAPAESAAAGSEKMDPFTLKFNPERTRKDTALFRTGSYSLGISPGSKPEIIDVQGFSLDDGGMVSLWIASENKKPITLVFTGYNQNTSVFTKEFTHEPVAPLQWDMKQFTVEPDKSVNRMTISIKTGAQINLDDLSIESYK